MRLERCDSCASSRSRFAIVPASGANGSAVTSQKEISGPSEIVAITRERLLRIEKRSGMAREPFTRGTLGEVPTRYQPEQERTAPKKTLRSPWLDLVQRSRARNCETARPAIWFQGANAKRTTARQALVRGHGRFVDQARSASMSMTWRFHGSAQTGSIAHVWNALVA